jgi:bifunctional non-homologous end joining protein LigD
VRILGAMQTPDGAWRVEAVRRGRESLWYRIIHGDNQIDMLTISMVQQILADAGVDMAQLDEVDPAA